MASTKKDIYLEVKINTTDAVKGLETAREKIKQIDREIANLQKTEAVSREQEQDIISEITELTERRKAYTKEIQRYSKEIQNDIRLNSEAEGSLAALRAALSNLTKQYDALSRADRNSAVGAKLLDDINAITTELNAAEQATQRYYRNVGNYQSAFNGLGFSVQQVARELPSLAMGANTFFLAISNNLPILADNIRIAREEYKMLIAEGKAATPVWKQLLSSIASWQTLMVVGITALSVYGKDIIEFVGNLFKQKEAFDASVQAAADYHKTIAEGRVEAQKEISSLETMYDVATDATKSMELRREAIATLQKEYPSYLGNLSEEEIMTGKAAGAYDALKNRMLEIAQTRAVMNRLTELSAAQFSAEYRALQEATDAYSRRNQGGLNQVVDIFYDKEKKAMEEAAEAFNEKFGFSVTTSVEAIQVIDAEINKLKNSLTTFNTEVTEAEVEMGKVVEQVNTDLYNADVEAIERKKSLLTMRAQLEFRAAEELEAELFQIKQDAQRERLALDRENGKITAEEFETQLALLSQEETDFFNEQAARIEDNATQLRNAMIELAGGLSVKSQLAELEAQYKQAFQTLAKNAKISADERAYYEEQLTKEWAKRKKEILAKSEKETTDKIAEELEERKKLQQAYADAVTELAYSLNDMFAAFGEAQMKRAEDENEAEKNALKKRLDAGLISQKKYDKEVAKLDEELAKKKAKIAREQAIRDKALNVAQIAMNTAAAVMKIWKDAGITAPIFTAMAIAAGAAQTAAVLATPIPEARTGGMVAGRTHENGGVLMNLEDEERIVGAKPSKAFPELLNLIAYIGNHAQMPNTGYATRSMMIESSAGASTHIDADALAQKIGEQVGDVIRQAPIYLSLTELREEQEIMTRIEESAKL